MMVVLAAIILRDEDLDLLFVRRVVETGEERDAVHVLRFLERVRNVVGPYDAERQVDALAEEVPHLLIHGRVETDGQISGRRQLDDAAVDEDPG